MTAQTSRYGIQYPTGSDLVSNIPQHMQNAANSIEQALADVDDRHTTAAYSPVIRNTYTQLKTVSAQVGQLGFVTGDNALYHGAYVYNGTDWTVIDSRDITSMITNVMDNDKYKITALHAMLCGKLLHLTFKVTRTGGSITSVAEETIMTLPTTLKLGEYHWPQIEPRFGIYVGAAGAKTNIQLGKDPSFKQYPQNQQIDFSFTLQASL